MDVAVVARRWMLGAVLLASLGLLLAPRTGAAQGADYPSRPVRLIVPYGAGGGADVVARLIADNLAPRLGQAVVVENRPGANGAIGTAAVAKAEPDGHTLALVVSSHVFGRALVPNLPFDPVKDFAPVTLATRSPIVLVASASLPVKTLGDLVAYVRARPDELAFASAGNGSNVHVFGQWFNDLARLRMIHVPYKGSSAAHLDLISGRVAMAFDTLASVQPHVAAGKLKLLAVAGPRRLEPLPDVPTVAEAGVPGFEAESWTAVLAPAATPRPVVDRLQREIAAVLRMPAVRERLKGAGVQVVGSSPDELKDVLVTQEKRYGDLIRRLGITLD
jgi:tripartite-type tricarboxylate transporter receptor subunit TctC